MHFGSSQYFWFHVAYIHCLLAEIILASLWGTTPTGVKSNAQGDLPGPQDSHPHGTREDWSQAGLT
jgi:hypothetical protein